MPNANVNVDDLDFDQIFDNVAEQEAKAELEKEDGDTATKPLTSAKLATGVDDVAVKSS